jgi:hypothetical protein
MADSYWEAVNKSPVILAAMVIIIITTTTMLAMTAASTAADAAAGAVPDFNIGLAGDWGHGPGALKTATNMASHGVEMVVGLGDYSYCSGACTDDWWNSKMSPIHDKMKGAIGDHDVGEVSKFSNLFDECQATKNNNNNTGTGAGGCYTSFNYQNIHFTLIDVSQPYGPGSPQYEFVKNDLASSYSSANTMEYKIVVVPEAMYTAPAGNHTIRSANSTIRDAYHPLFDKYRVDLVVEGDIHDYQRSYPLKFNPENAKQPIITTATNTTTAAATTTSSNSSSSYTDPEGEIYLVVGTGGHGLYGLRSKPYFNVVEMDDTYGYLDLSMTENGHKLVGRFYSNDGTVRDTFSIIK